jgi:hypothetical protein
MLRYGWDPARGLNPFQVATILKRALEKLAARPEMLRVLARAVAADRELAHAQRVGRDLAPDCESFSTPASAELY